MLFCVPSLPVAPCPLPSSRGDTKATLCHLGAAFQARIPSRCPQGQHGALTLPVCPSSPACHLRPLPNSPNVPSPRTSAGRGCSFGTRAPSAAREPRPCLPCLPQHSLPSLYLAPFLRGREFYELSQHVQASVNLPGPPRLFPGFSGRCLISSVSEGGGEVTGTSNLCLMGTGRPWEGVKEGEPPPRPSSICGFFCSPPEGARHPCSSPSPAAPPKPPHRVGAPPRGVPGGMLLSRGAASRRVCPRGENTMSPGRKHDMSLRNAAGSSPF